MMIEEALQQGIASHKAGKLQDAERLYRAILAVEPTYPDANHNLGVLTIQAGNTEACLPFFKTALKSYPTCDQFWISYIEALGKTGALEAAFQILSQGKARGLAADVVASLEQQLRWLKEKMK